MSVQEFVKQGEIDLAGTILCIGSAGGPLTKVLVLNFNNVNAYTLTLTRYNAQTANTIILYRLNLGAGDVIADTLTYALNVGDTLIVYSDIPGTSYYAHGTN